MNGQTIYIISCGDYDSCTVVVFDDKELAEGYIKLNPHQSYLHIEEWILNPCEDIIRQELKIYRFEMKQDGTYEDHGYPREAQNEATYHFYTVEIPYVDKLEYATGDVVMDYQVCAKNELIALKMANKLRLQLIQEGKWGVNPA